MGMNGETMLTAISKENDRLKAALAYLLGFFTAVPILLKAGGDRYVKFHAWQSIIWSIVEKWLVS